MTGAANGGRIAAAIAGLRTHSLQTRLVKTMLRDAARRIEELAGMTRHNAFAATLAAMGPAGPPTPEYSRRATWGDRVRLLERAAALDEVASAIRCELTESDYRAARAAEEAVM